MSLVEEIQKTRLSLLWDESRRNPQLPALFVQTYIKYDSTPFCWIRWNQNLNLTRQETRCGNNLAGSNSNLCEDSLLTGHSQSVSSQSVCRRFYHRWLAVHGTDLPLLHRLDFSMSFSTVCSFYGTTAKANLGRRPRLSLTINQVTLLNKEWFIRTLLLKAVPTHPEPSLCY